MHREMFPEWKNEYCKDGKFLLRIYKFENKKSNMPMLKQIILKHSEKKITGYQKCY